MGPGVCVTCRPLKKDGTNNLLIYVFYHIYRIKLTSKEFILHFLEENGNASTKRNHCSSPFLHICVRLKNSSTPAPERFLPAQIETPPVNIPLEYWHMKKIPEEDD
jgi:hypothetical protein